MPVAHRDKTVRVDPLASELAFERSGLTLCIGPDWRSAPDDSIVMLHLARTGSRNQFGEGFPPDSGKREVDNVGIAEEVIKKRFDRFQLVGSPELK